MGAVDPFSARVGLIRPGQPRSMTTLWRKRTDADNRPTFLHWWLTPGTPWVTCRPWYWLGERQSSILVAFVNALVLFVTVGAIAWVAVRRFRASSPPVTEKRVIWVTAIGTINAGTAFLFLSGRNRDVREGFWKASTRGGPHETKLVCPL